MTLFFLGSSDTTHPKLENAPTPASSFPIQIQQISTHHRGFCGSHFLTLRKCASESLLLRLWLIQQVWHDGGPRHCTLLRSYAVAGLGRAWARDDLGGLSPSLSHGWVLAGSWLPPKCNPFRLGVLKSAGSRLGKHHRYCI